MTTTNQPIISRLEAFITEALTAPDLEELYDSMLDDTYSFEQVGGPFENMSPSRVLKGVDPTMYRCGLNDWADQDFVEVGDKMYWKEEVEEKQEEFCETLRAAVDDLEAEIEVRIQYPTPARTAHLPALREQLASLQSDLQLAECHCF